MCKGRVSDTFLHFYEGSLLFKQLRTGFYWRHVSLSGWGASKLSAYGWGKLIFMIAWIGLDLSMSAPRFWFIICFQFPVSSTNIFVKLWLNLEQYFWVAASKLFMGSPFQNNLSWHLIIVSFRIWSCIPLTTTTYIVLTR